MHIILVCFLTEEETTVFFVAELYFMLQWSIHLCRLAECWWAPKKKKVLHNILLVYNKSAWKLFNKQFCAGVWTDGIWVFSTGLDQRVRCWILDQHFKLVEHGHIIVSVPEPEAIDAQACGR